MPALDMNLGPGRFLRKCANIRDGRQASQVLQELRFSLGRSLCDVLQDLVDHETKEESGAEHALSKIAPILRLRWDPLIRGPMAWLEVEHYSCEALGFDQVNLNIERETYATKAPALNEVLFLACDAGATQHAYVTLNVQELMGTTTANAAAAYQNAVRRLRRAASGDGTSPVDTASSTVTTALEVTSAVAAHAAATARASGDTVSAARDAQMRASPSGSLAVTTQQVTRAATRAAVALAAAGVDASDASDATDATHGADASERAHAALNMARWAVQIVVLPMARRGTFTSCVEAVRAAVCLSMLLFAWLRAKPRGHVPGHLL